MPRIPIDYANTIIYKIVHQEDYDNANVYIGSTTDFRMRKTTHKYSCNNENDKNYNQKKYQYIRENGGWDCFNMVEIEKYPCNDGNEAKAREEYWRCYFNANLNSIKAFIIKEERHEQQKIKMNEWIENNKEYLTIYRKEWYNNNKEYRKLYIKEKITCECGCILAKGNMKDHLKTEKHINLINIGAFETH
jgi:hypothetical protein